MPAQRSNFNETKMDFTESDITAVSEIIVRAVRECRDVLIAAAARPAPERPTSAAPEAPVPRLPDLLTRPAAVIFLRDKLGYPVSEGWLRQLAVIGGGPPFQSFGRRVVYDPADLRRWAEDRSRRRLSTSDSGTPVTSVGGHGRAPPRRP